MKRKSMFALFSSCLIAAASCMPVLAYDYSDEDAWYQKCTTPQTSQEGVDACVGFQEYQQQKKEQLENDIDQYTKDIESLKGDVSRMAELSKQQKELSQSLQTQIEDKQKVIDEIQAQITKLVEEIEKTQAEIDQWDAQIKGRMQAEQSSVGTNMFIDLIMGARNLNDMLRRLSGMERITENDQDQIDTLNALKEKIEMQKSEQERLNADATSQKEQLEEQKAQADQLEKAYKQLESEYQQKMAELEQQMRSAFTDIASIKNFVISTNFAGEIVATGGFISPISGGYKSAGTWAYPGGGLHLGLDYAVSIGTPVVAPANGIILYANNPVASNGGYLGNWSGYPAGGGNTLEMLCQVNGTTYAISFAHLSQGGFAVSAGSSVSQGQVLALTGNSGNSSGPHCHIEVYNLGSMSVSDAVARFSAGADFSWGTGWNTTSTSCEAGAATPCRERPERFFG